MLRIWDGKAILLVAACAIAALGQAPLATGTIQGKVVDGAGGSVAQARVSVTQANTGLARATEVDAEGHFYFPALPPGDYDLRVEKEGFAPVLVPGLLLAVGQTLVQRVELKLAPVSERVEVRERPEALETVSTTAGVALGLERIEEAPASNRNYLNFVLVAPAVAPCRRLQRAALACRAAQRCQRQRLQFCWPARPQ